MPNQNDQPPAQTRPEGQPVMENFNWLNSLLAGSSMLEPARAALRWLAEYSRLMVIVAIAVETLPFSIFPISVNAQRTTQLSMHDGIIQRGAADLGKLAMDDPRVGEIKGAVAAAERQRASLLGQIGYGMWLCRPPEVTTDCLDQASKMLPLPLPGWFHGNSSENNNILLSLASGIIGAILAIASKADAGGVRLTLPLRNSLFQIMTGAIAGLLALYVVKGMKGASLMSISDAIDVSAPYGIALFSTLAGLFSDEFIKVLGSLIRKRQTDKGSSPP